MDQHPIPRQITTFEFKLIGFLTIKQFLYLAVSLPLAYVVMQIFPIPLLNVILGFAVGAVGILTAFVPIKDRTLDVWAKNIWKRLQNPTQYYYKKQNDPLYFLRDLYFLADPHHMLAHIESKDKLSQYLAMTKQRPKADYRKKQVGALLHAPTDVLQKSTAPVVPNDHAPGTAPAPLPTPAQQMMGGNQSVATVPAQPVVPAIVNAPVSGTSSVSPATVPVSTPPETKPDVPEKPANPFAGLAAAVASSHASGPVGLPPMPPPPHHIEHGVSSPVVAAVPAAPVPMPTPVPVMKVEVQPDQQPIPMPTPQPIVAQVIPPGAPAPAVAPVSASTVVPAQSVPAPVVPQSAPPTPTVTPSPAPAAPPTDPFFVGVIRNSKKIPLPGVLVYIKDGSGTPVRILKTNPHGVFATFNPIPLGDYSFEIKDPNGTYFFDTMKQTVKQTNPMPFEFQSREIL